MTSTFSTARNPRHRGIMAVTIWHGAALALVAALTGMAVLILMPGADPYAFVPGWLVAAILGAGAAVAVTASYVIAVLIMGLFAPRTRRVDLEAHGLAVSLGSLLVGVPVLLLVLRALGWLLGNS